MRDPRLLEYAKQMRRAPTKAETIMWLELRAKRLNGIKFRKQKVIGSYIADFASRDPMLVVEIDGDTHGNLNDYDLERTTYLEQQGYRVIRFTNIEVIQNLNGVLETLAAVLDELTSPLPTLSPEGERTI